MNKPWRIRSLLIFILLLMSPVYTLWSASRRKKLDIDIVFIGNSITEGAQLNKPAEEAPPATASNYLRIQKKIGSVGLLIRAEAGLQQLIIFLPLPVPLQR